MQGFHNAKYTTIKTDNIGLRSSTPLQHTFGRSFKLQMR